MRNFAYRRVDGLTDAVSAGAHGAAFLAGGTELLNWMRLGILDADDVADIGRIAALREIESEGGQIRIGALATLNEIGESALVADAAPVLAQACLQAASAQLRNLATIGGNVLQKTRCPYFRAEAPAEKPMPWPCNKREAGSGCAAKESGNSRLALFGWTDRCAATQPSDPAVALAALDATVDLMAPAGPRSIAMTSFHLTQQEAESEGSNGGSNVAALENRLKHGEVITGYRVPVDAASRRSGYLKVRERASYEYAMVSAAVAVDLRGDRIQSVRIALGSVAQKPWRLPAAERALAGAPLQAPVVASALEAALAEARPLGGNEFKVQLARDAALRAILATAGRR